MRLINERATIKAIRTFASIRLPCSEKILLCVGFLNQRQTFLQGGPDKTSALPGADDRETGDRIAENPRLLYAMGGRFGAVQSTPEKLSRHVLQLKTLVRMPHCRRAGNCQTHRASRRQSGFDVKN